MRRFHVHLSVVDLSQSIRFYSTLFGTEPSVVKDDYAKWMLEDPRVHFAVSTRGQSAGLNHLGLQVEDALELQSMRVRLESADASLVEETAQACCYAKSDKYWITDPQGIAWESFRTLESIPVFGDSPAGASTGAACCVPLAPAAAVSGATCCVPVSASREACCAA
jgi:catechol 2,3-dioxygenase-like lactoylglutathione lyase family enzyme